MRHGLLPAAVACLVGFAVAQPSGAADPLIVAGRSGKPASMAAEDVAALPAVGVTVSFETEHGKRQASFEGPLLWTLLEHARALDLGKPREQVRQFVTITGRDGYTAVLALGEMSPAFEGKQVILAERMDGQPLAPDHFRVIVPGDARGGRSVRDVARIVVGPAAPDQGE